MRAGTSLTGLGRYNENVVIHAFRRLGASSQRDVAASTGLSVQTVSAIVRGLQGRGLLAEVGTRSMAGGVRARSWISWPPRASPWGCTSIPP